jgi:hypothetical protein
MPNAALSKGRAKVNGKTQDVRQMLLELGVGSFNAEMAIQYAFMLPRTVDPYAPGVMILMEALQRGLNKLGCDLFVDGGLGAETEQCLIAVSGSRWYDKSFVQLMGDILTSDPIKKKSQAMGDYIAVGQTTFLGDLFSSGLGWIGLGFAGWYFFLRKGK